MKSPALKIETTYKVPNLEKGIRVLETLAAGNRAMTLQEIIHEVDISQTTAYRILHTLGMHGYIIHNEISKKYKLTRKILSVGFQTIQERSMLEVALPRMRELRDIVKETVFFGVMGEERGLFIEQVLGKYPFCFVIAPGKLFELHCSAPGKAMMAFMPEKMRNNYLARMTYEKFNENTIQTEEVYLKELEKVRKSGYALDMEEELHGVVCVGVPIFDYSNIPCGTIWISGPRDRLPPETLLTSANALMACSRSISFELGYNKTVN